MVNDTKPDQIDPAEHQIESVARGSGENNTTVHMVHKKRQELNGPKGLEPTRYGDWEKNGRCIDF